MTKIQAHRGASGYAPQNTMAAFRKAVEMNSDGIELDIHLSKDGQIVVCHDSTIDATSNGTGEISDMTYEEILKYDFSNEYTQDSPQHAPLLKEVLELLKPTNMILNIEVKAFDAGVPAMELVKSMGMEKQVLYSSFNHRCIRQMRELDPTIDAGLLYGDEPSEDMEAYIKEYNATAVHPHYNNVNEKIIDICNRNGIKIRTWTVNGEDKMEEMIKFNIDTVITNYPDKAIEIRDSIQKQ